MPKDLKCVEHRDVRENVSLKRQFAVAVDKARGGDEKLETMIHQNDSVRRIRTQVKAIKMAEAAAEKIAIS